MRQKPIVTLSHSTQILTRLMGERLFFKGQKPFARKMVLLPDLSIKNPLLASFVSNGTLDVILGIEFLELGSGVQTLFKLCTQKSLLFPPLDLLALQLESLMKMPGLAPKLAIEFLKYGKYGGPFLKKWEGHWQKTLWDQVFSRWNYPYELLDTSLNQPDQEIEVHLFNFPFLPKLYHLFFERLSQYLPVYYYQFSPCREFWSDTVTDFEKMHLLEKDDKMAPYLEQGHPLLANLGKMGRENFRVLEEEDFTFDEHYNFSSEGSYLANLQEDILGFKDRRGKQDESILLLPAPTKLREVEILYAKLLEVDVKPSDIQVFAPDISSYAPLIDFVFKSEESPFDVMIYDLPDHPLLQTFLDFLSLDRFTPDALFKLFTSPYFFRLSEKETKCFKGWIDQSGVKWGVDAEHRKEILPTLLDETEDGTWKQAFDFFLTHLIYLPEKPSEWDVPYLDFSDAEILGKGIFLIESMRADLEDLQSAHLRGEEWSERLLLLFHRYFHSEEETFSFFQEKILLLKTLEGLFSFARIKRYLKHCLKSKRGERTTRNLEALTFRSLRPGTIFSSKIIALLGMHEGAYPRPFIASSLNLLGKESDYCPIAIDEDRFLFLQVVMSAQKQLLITYQSISDEDGKERPPSTLVQDLDPTLEAHPPFPFHPHYFSEARPYPKRHYETALTLYQGKEKAPFIPEYLHPTPLPHPRVQEGVTLEDLNRFAKHPLRFYCNRILNLYLHYEENSDEEFFLSPLQKYKLFQGSEEIEIAKKHGRLPLGRFKEIAERKIKKEWEEIASFETFPYELKNSEGSLQIAEEGFPFLGTSKLEDLVKIYPLYLALCIEKPLPLIPLRSGKRFELKSDPQKAFEDYLHYYFLSCETPSPLLPLLAAHLLTKDRESFASKIKSISLDPYSALVFGSPNLYDPHVIFETWAPLLRKTFKPLLEMVELEPVSSHLLKINEITLFE